MDTLASALAGITVLAPAPVKPPGIPCTSSVGRAQVHVDRLAAGVPADHGGIELEGQRMPGPGLHADVGELRAVPGVKVVGADRERAGVAGDDFCIIPA